MENWIPKYIIGYMIYLTFIVYIMANATLQGVNILNLSAEQKAILSGSPTDLLTFLNQVVVLSSVSSTYALVSIITGILGIIWLMAIIKALKEIIPALPS